MRLIRRHKMSWIFFLGIVCVSAAFGQGSSVGTITGTVMDPSGAPMPDVQVTLHNSGTNEARETRSGSLGFFTVTSLPVGTYDLTATATGFQTIQIRDIKLDVNATFRVDVNMTVGQVTETVSVEAQAPLLNTENASTGQIIESKRVTELPLNGRDFQQLQLLSPGPISGTNFQNSQGLSGGASSLTTTGTMNVSNGGRPGQVLFTIDGSNASNQNGRGIIWQPSIDEIQEFKTETSNMSAEFGYGSTTVNVSIKSGTNKLHGAAWEFLRNDTIWTRALSSPRGSPRCGATSSAQTPAVP